MAAVFTALLRGLMGVAASVLIVTIVWTLYIQRESVSAAGQSVMRLLPGEAPAPAEPRP